MISFLEHGPAGRTQFADVLLHAGGDLLLVRNFRTAKMHCIATTGLFLFILRGCVRSADGYQRGQAGCKQGSVSIHIRSGYQVSPSPIQARPGRYERKGKNFAAPHTILFDAPTMGNT
jgi:hypothetical protein